MLLLALFGLGTNTGLKRVGNGQADTDYKDLLYVRRRDTDLRDVVLGPNVEVRVSEDKQIIFRVKSDPTVDAAATKADEAAGRRLRDKPVKEPAKTKRPRKPKD